jgi:addiction module RelE/StbE family toxin
MRPAQIRWTSDAANDLEQILRHILLDRPGAASEVIQTVTESIGRLGAFPYLGRTGQVPGTRELVITSLPYVAVYRLKQNTVEVLRIYHAAQDWP